MRRATSFSSSSTDGSDTKTGPDSWCCHLAFADMHIYMFPESFGIGMDRNEGLASYGPAAHVGGLACIMFGALTGAYLAPAAGLPVHDLWFPDNSVAETPCYRVPVGCTDAWPAEPGQLGMLRRDLRVGAPSQVLAVLRRHRLD